MEVLLGIASGFIAFLAIYCLLGGIYTVNQNERAVVTNFGKAERIGHQTTLSLPQAEMLTAEEKERYVYPQVRVVQPGGPYLRLPWQRIHKVSMSIQTINVALDPDMPEANSNATSLEAVTKDQLNIRLTGQVRYRVSEQNLYAYLFGVKKPISHVMGFFVSVLRERIANYEAPALKEEVTGPEKPAESLARSGVSINDLRKNLNDLNQQMDRECRSSAARYGIVLDASLITGIDPPPEIDIKTWTLAARFGQAKHAVPAPNVALASGYLVFKPLTSFSCPLAADRYRLRSGWCLREVTHLHATKYVRRG